MVGASSGARRSRRCRRAGRTGRRHRARPRVALGAAPEQASPRAKPQEEHNQPYGPVQPAAWQGRSRTRRSPARRCAGTRRSGAATRASDSITRSCGSTPMRGGVFVIGGRGCRGPPARTGPMSQITSAASRVREAVDRRDAEYGSRPCPGRGPSPAAQVRPDRAGLHLGRDVGDLVVAEREQLQHLVARRVRAAGRSSCARRSRSARRGPRASGSATAAAAAPAGPGRTVRAPTRTDRSRRCADQQAVVHRAT